MSTIINTTNIEFIVLGGYYALESETEEMKEHTDDTIFLYNKGLDEGNEKRDSLNDTLDVYEGVSIEYGKANAQWYSETSGKTYYFQIQ